MHIKSFKLQSSMSLKSLYFTFVFCPLIFCNGYSVFRLARASAIMLLDNSSCSEDKPAWRRFLNNRTYNCGLINSIFEFFCGKMPLSCAAYGCHSHNKMESKPCFHRFQNNNPEHRQKWIAACKRVNEDKSSWNPTGKNVFLCGKHFVTGMLLRSVSMLIPFPKISRTLSALFLGVETNLTFCFSFYLGKAVNDL